MSEKGHYDWCPYLVGNLPLNECKCNNIEFKAWFNKQIAQAKLEFGNKVLGYIDGLRKSNELWKHDNDMVAHMIMSFIEQELKRGGEDG